MRAYALDRDALLDLYCRKKGLVVSALPVPAEILDEVLEDLLGMRVVPQIMARDLLGYCDFDLREVGYNLDIPRFAYENTFVEGVINSTKAHELGHVRLGHEMELRAERDVLTASLFDTTTMQLSCESRRPSTDDRREGEANLYAATFLVPENQLLVHDEARRIEQCRRDGTRLGSTDLWHLVRFLSERFRVTPSLMAHRLDDLGWIARKPNPGGHPINLSIPVEAWLPLPVEQ